MVAFHQQDYIKARRAGEEALPILLEIGDKSNAGFALSNLGYVVQKLGETSQALAYFRQSLQLMHEVGYIRGVFLGLEAIATLLVDLDQHLELALHLLSAADQLRQKTNLAVSPSEQPEYDCLLARLRQQLDNATFNTQWDAGQTTPLDQIVAKAAQLSLT